MQIVDLPKFTTADAPQTNLLISAQASEDIPFIQADSVSKTFGFLI